MALFGRETHADRDRADRVRKWVQARTPYAMFSGLLGIVSVLDAFTLVIGLTAGAVAILLALMGLRDLKQRTSLLGQRLCYAGMCLGATGMGLSLVFWTVVYPMIANK